MTTNEVKKINDIIGVIFDTATQMIVDERSDDTEDISLRVLAVMDAETRPRYHVRFFASGHPRTLWVYAENTFNIN